MSYIVVDCESDGPIPHKYSMVCFGAVIVEPSLEKTFYGKTKPTSDLWIPEALAVSGFSREEHMEFEEPEAVFRRFGEWIKENSKGSPIFISDNLAYDWQFVNFYFHYFTGSNPFGYSGRRIGDMYAGMKMDTFVKWKHLRKTRHTHHPVDDAKGNAEVLLQMKDMGLKIKLV
jgi:hypothetical protein